MPSRLDLRVSWYSDKIEIARDAANIQGQDRAREKRIGDYHCTLIAQMRQAFWGDFLCNACSQRRQK
jgi:hypothetical protein